MNVKQFENDRWGRDDQVISFRHEAALGMINDGTVLDLGSGDGLFLSLLRQKGILGEGLDISEEGVAKTLSKGLKASIFDFNGRIPFNDNTFDTVVMLDLLEHLYDPEVLLREAVRVSKKHVIVSVPNFNSLPARLQVIFGKVPENNRPKKGHVFWFNLPILRNMFGQVGLKVVKLRTNTFFESVPYFRYITKNLSEITPNAFSLSFVVEGEKITQLRGDLGLGASPPNATR